jgi:hypothetical protein
VKPSIFFLKTAFVNDRKALPGFPKLRFEAFPAVPVRPSVTVYALP